jgi:hypothetical protein
MWAALSTSIDPIRLQSGPAIPTLLRHSDGMRCCKLDLLGAHAWC